MRPLHVLVGSLLRTTRVSTLSGWWLGAAVLAAATAARAQSDTLPPLYGPAPPAQQPPPAAAPYAPPPATTPPPLQTGGLQAPSSAPPTTYPAALPPDGSTEQRLDESTHHDSGRGLEFVYLDAEAGLQQVGLRTLHTNNLVPEQARTSDTGAMFGVGAGLRLVFLTIGPRFRIGHFSDWDLWSLDGELGLHLPLGDVEPHFTFGAGYSKLGNASVSGLTSDSDVHIRGYNVRLGFGIDYYVTRSFSIGGNFTGEMLVLTRPGLDPTKLANQANAATAACSSQPTPQAQQSCLQAQVYSVDGSSIGLSGALSLVLGLHF